MAKQTKAQTAPSMRPMVSLVQLLGAREAAEVVYLGKRQTRLEKVWTAKMRALMDEMTTDIITNARETGRLKFEWVDFAPALMHQSYDVMKAGIESTEPRVAVRAERLAAPPKGRVPRSLKALRQWWDDYQKTKRPTPRQRDLAEGLRQAYIEKVQEVWRRHSEDFLSGDEALQTEAIEAMRSGAHVTYARAQMIVETETTHYFNKSRRQIFDASPDVTHYLFMAIRDHATTKWCKTRQGLIYAKTDPLLERETPPCHWNCRSELLPLTKHNANHLRLIQDARRQRRNNSPEPLPQGWTGRKNSR